MLPAENDAVDTVLAVPARVDFTGSGASVDGVGHGAQGSLKIPARVVGAVKKQGKFRLFKALSGGDARQCSRRIGFFGVFSNDRGGHGPS